MKNKIKNLFKIVVVTAGCLLFASFSPSLDGRAVVVEEGVFPQGLFAKTVGYLPGDIISVTNIAGDKTIDLLVIGALDPSEGVAIMLSPEAAEAMGIDRGANNIVKITKRSGQDERVYGNAVISKSASEIEDWDDSNLENISAEENTEAFDEEDEAETDAEFEDEEAFDEEAESDEEAEEEFAEPEDEEFAEPEDEEFTEPEEEAAVPEDEESEEAFDEAIDEEVPEEETEEAIDEEVPETPAEEAEESEEESDEEAFEDDNEFAEEEQPAEETTEEEDFEEEAEAEEFEETPEELEAEPETSEEYTDEAPEELEEKPAAEAFEDEALDELPAEKTPAEEEAEELAEEPEEFADESEYEAIVLVPADSNPPENKEEDEVEDVIAADEFVEVEDEITLTPLPVESTKSVTTETPVAKEDFADKKFTPAPAATTSYDKYMVSSLKDLESGKYYIQIAVYSADENILDVINKYGTNYPITIVPMAGGNKKQILVGPVTMDEYKVVLERFKSYGFKDAFLRKIK